MRMALVLAIMLAPQPGIGVFVLVFSVGHIGTAAPVMLTWLVLDRFGLTRRDGTTPTLRQRWYIPLIIAVLLAWALMADPLVLVVAIYPAAGRSASCGWSPAPSRGARHGRRAARSAPGARRPLARAVAGGRRRDRLSGRLVGRAAAQQRRRLQPAGRSVPPSTAARPLVHAGPGRGARPAGDVRRLLRPRQRDQLQVARAVSSPRRRCPGSTRPSPSTRVVVRARSPSGAAARSRAGSSAATPTSSASCCWPGSSLNLVAYIPSTLADHSALNVREIAPVLPFAAVLAGRMLGDRLLALGPLIRVRLPRISRAARAQADRDPAGGAVRLVQLRPVPAGRHPGRRQPVHRP